MKRIRWWWLLFLFCVMGPYSLRDMIAKGKEYREYER